MKKQKLTILFAAALCLSGATGCVSTTRTMMPGSIVAANKPVEQGKYTVLNDGNVVSGKYTFDFLKSNNDVNGSAMKKAVDQALAQCPGADALVGITTDSMTETKMLVFPFSMPLKMEFTTFVTGVPVKTND